MFERRKSLRDYMVGAFVGDIHDPTSRKPETNDNPVPEASPDTSQPVADNKPTDPKPQ